MVECAADIGIYFSTNSEVCYGNADCNCRDAGELLE